MNVIVDVFENEPAAAFGSLGMIATGALELAAAYGLSLPPAAHIALGIIGGGIVMGVTLLAIRSKVTPTATLGIVAPTPAA